ncbi:cysteine rich repeat-containing protein [Xanthobacter sp. V4C-4]|uniref:cysteine rich repeat-containing protein n=1 Tax=Xanthobacter cornucopiae TaxID=3119924 RepID=UPI00372A530E
MKAVILALAIAGSMAFATSSHAQEDVLVKYCKPDIERLCATVAPGGGRLLKCLKAHGEQISVGCAKALQQLKG